MAFSVEVMAPGGLMFAVVLVMWLAYLVPTLASRREAQGADDSGDPFAESMTIIKRSTDPFSEEPDPLLEVSTPLTRAAARHEIRQSYRLAARRRRRVVVTLVVATVAAGAITFAPLSIKAPWWVPLVPLALLLAFLAIARFSVVSLNRTLDARIARVDRGWDEETISFEVPADLREDATEHSVELSGPVAQTGSLWDPIPVTAPTYVSKPMAARTIRTIDLSAPVQEPADNTPVIAEPTLAVELTQEVSLQDQQRPRAVGE